MLWLKKIGTHKFNFTNRHQLIPITLLIIYILALTYFQDSYYLNKLLLIIPTGLCITANLITIIFAQEDHPYHFLFQQKQQQQQQPQQSQQPPKLNKIASIIFLCLVYSVLILFIKKANETTSSSIYHASSYDQLLFQQKIELIYREYPHLNSNENNKKKYSIFFLETQYAKVEFTTKQMCAIESAARNNPNSFVQIYSFRSVFNTNNNVSLFNNYPNLRIRRLNPDVVFNNTPLMVWWASGRVKRSQHAYAHISDAARLALLWKYGGVYSDLDTVTIKSFESLVESKTNGVGYLFEGYESIGNGILLFRAHHPFLEYVMEKFAKDYVPDIWGQNGPTLILNSLKTYCDYEDVFLNLMSTTLENRSKKNSSSNKCNDMVIYPEQYFYPYRYFDGQYNILFAKNGNKSLDLSSKLNDTYSVHFYGSLSIKLKARVNDNSVFSKLAEQNCESTYDYVKSNRLLFE